MGLIKRLQNLWKLSAYNPQYDVETVNGTLRVEDQLTIRKQPKQIQAKIVDMTPIKSDIPIINENNPAE